MRVTIAAVGRLRDGPEATLVALYRERFGRTGARLGLGPLEIAEVEDRRGGGPPAEAALLRAAVPPGASLWALDGRGRLLSSDAFAAALARLRDDGVRDLCFLIGGADGLDPALRAEAGERLSFGPMVWPHLLARVMLSEQLFRAAGILAGTPYHRA